MVGWSDNQHVLIAQATFNGFLINGPIEPTPVLVLDITNGERKVIHPDFPSFLEPVSDLPDWNGLIGISYNSTLTRAIYLSNLENPDDMYTYGLLDVAKNQRLALLDSVFASYDIWEIYRKPVWAEDGSFAVVVGFTPHTSQSVNQTSIYEIYKINLDGSYEQLTHLWPAITEIHEGISLSPDNQYLISYVNPEGNKQISKARLTVLDLGMNTISDYCLDIHQVFNYPRPAIWSPDSSKFIVVNRFGLGRPRAILVDIINKTASVLAEDMEPVGWMLSP